MKIDFIPLANVPTVESLTDSAKVLVIDNGEVKRTAKSNIGGGGGSSDFTTAEVTFTGTGSELFYCPVMLGGNLSCGVTMGSQITESRKYTVVFSTDGSVNMILNGATQTEITGDASYDEDTNEIYIWGDCTINIVEA